jgi:hypothetical protein
MRIAAFCCIRRDSRRRLMARIGKNFPRCSVSCRGAGPGILVRQFFFLNRNVLSLFVTIDRKGPKAECGIGRCESAKRSALSRHVARRGGDVVWRTRKTDKTFDEVPICFIGM